MDYYPAPEAKLLAVELIAAHHTHLRNVRIEFVFQAQESKVKGKETWGWARKIGGLSAFLATQPAWDEGSPFFVVGIVWPVWERLNAKARRALVDHELCHCWVEDEKTLVLLGHDLEEFGDVVKRHGFWRADVERFLRMTAQLNLPLEDAPVLTVVGEG